MADRVPEPRPAGAVMLRYYITDRRSCAGNPLPLIERAVAEGVDYIQVREKDLSARAMVDLVRAAVKIAAGTRTRILVNERADVADAAGAHGVHLPAGSPPPALYKPLLVAVSCHSAAEVLQAAAEAADFVVFSPIFASPGKGPGAGLDALGNACRAASIPVLALGGITLMNVEACIQAGAAGVAGIRLFQVPGA